ncbi:hypothetical protein GCM10009858_45160 [Terrabacter carboxydivorans]|uniref:Uncharacterized protein n=1 Tax=Terrabacter carboxydivorans TaxID=619730 RepID=A0ABN3MH22_9MICO
MREGSPSTSSRHASYRRVFTTPDPAHGGVAVAYAPCVAFEIRVLNAECPVCEHYGPHPSDGGGRFTCVLCNTTFGTGGQSDEGTMTIDDDGGDWAKRMS